MGSVPYHLLVSPLMDYEHSSNHLTCDVVSFLVMWKFTGSRIEIGTDIYCKTE